MNSRPYSILAGPLPLLLAVIAVALAGPAFIDRNVRLGSGHGSVEEGAALVKHGEVLQLDPGTAGTLLVSESIGRPFEAFTGPVEIELTPDKIGAARLLSIPQAMQWRHPEAGLPAARVVRHKVAGEFGMPGPTVTQTYLFQDHAPLRVVSIVSDHDGLFDPDKGIMVVGNAYLTVPEKLLGSYQRDPRWWKYPGNFMHRGKEWERDAHMEVIGVDGSRISAQDIRIRIHGQMTRGFPQHALRLTFDQPFAPVASGDVHSSMVLRAAGNDQVKAMMRDPLQQSMCAGLPFSISKATTCVLYLNGAYWGMYHLRERVDHEWLATRFGLPAKEITVLEDAAALYRGDEGQVRHFLDVLRMAEKGDVHMDRIREALDVDGFLLYMASQMILGNMDWPEQNVRYWRYTGVPVEREGGDGRWYFIMGDSDLAFGAGAGPATDPFIRVRNSSAPVARLFKALVKDPAVFGLFLDGMEQLLDGPLSSEAMTHKIDSMAGAMDGEMQRHTARWRKPANKAAWEREVQVMMDFARDRPRHVSDHIERIRPAGAI